MTGRVLLTGGTGQLGRELLRLDWGAGWTLDAPARSELDLADPQALHDRVRAGGYAAVINAAAYTAVDDAESDPIAAWQANALAPAALAAGCRAAGVPIVQLSTDYVFEGSGDRAWRPGDRIAPLSVYGASKAGGELAVRASGARYAILRTAWVVSAHGRNFVRTMLRLAAERDRLAVVADQHGSPTAARDLAQATQAVCRTLMEKPEFASGTWHVANAGFASWHELASHIVAEAGSLGRPAPRVEAIATADFPTPARRPANSRLDTTAIERDFGLRLRPWREATAEVVRELMTSEVA